MPRRTDALPHAFDSVCITMRLGILLRRDSIEPRVEKSM